MDKKIILLLALILNISNEAMLMKQNYRRSFSSSVRKSYPKVLAAVPNLKGLCNHSKSVVLIHGKPLFVHLAVQACKVRALEVYPPRWQFDAAPLKDLADDIKRQCYADNQKKENEWLGFKAREFYNLISRIPWDGTGQIQRDPFPILVNEDEIRLGILASTSKCEDPFSVVEILACNDFYKNRKHHKKICEYFTALVKNSKI